MPSVTARTIQPVTTYFFEPMNTSTFDIYLRVKGFIRLTHKPDTNLIVSYKYSVSSL